MREYLTGFSPSSVTPAGQLPELPLLSNSPSKQEGKVGGKSMKEAQSRITASGAFWTQKKNNVRVFNPVPHYYTFKWRGETFPLKNWVMSPRHAKTDAFNKMREVYHDVRWIDITVKREEKQQEGDIGRIALIKNNVLDGVEYSVCTVVGETYRLLIVFNWYLSASKWNYGTYMYYHPMDVVFSENEQAIVTMGIDDTTLFAYTIKPYSHRKDHSVIRCPSTKGFVGQAGIVAVEAGAKWVDRAKGWVISNRRVAHFQELLDAAQARSAELRREAAEQLGLS